MRNDENSKGRTQTHQKKPRFLLGVLQVVKEQTVLVGKDALSLFERDAMLGFVGTGLLGIPGKPSSPISEAYLRCNYNASHSWGT